MSTLIQLSKGDAIEYKAYARKFQPGSAAVLYIIATCYYPVGGYEIFFEPEYGLDKIRLMEKVPGISNQLVTYYQACWTTSQPLVSPPATVIMVDAQGEHTVPVEPWS